MAWPVVGKGRRGGWRRASRALLSSWDLSRTGAVPSYRDRSWALFYEQRAEGSEDRPLIRLGPWHEDDNQNQIRRSRARLVGSPSIASGKDSPRSQSGRRRAMLGHLNSRTGSLERLRVWEPCSEKGTTTSGSSTTSSSVLPGWCCQEVGTGSR